MKGDRHARVATLLREHGPLAPPALRARIEADLKRASEPPATGRPLGGLKAAAALAACLAALALAFSSLFGTEPDALDAHALSGRGPAEPAPLAQRSEPALLAARLDGVDFPNWTREFGWEAVGARNDQLDGRHTETVFYEHEGHVIGYTIVAGAPLDVPGDAERIERDGREVRLLRDDHGHDIAVFERGGMTCVLSGHVQRRSTLVKLATWGGEGRLTF